MVGQLCAVHPPNNSIRCRDSFVLFEVCFTLPLKRWAFGLVRKFVFVEI